MTEYSNIRDVIDELNIKLSLVQKDLFSLRQNLLDLEKYIDSNFYFPLI